MNKEEYITITYYRLKNIINVDGKTKIVFDYAPFDSNYSPGVDFSDISYSISDKRQKNAEAVHYFIFESTVDLMMYKNDNGQYMLYSQNDNTGLVDITSQLSPKNTMELLQNFNFENVLQTYKDSDSYQTDGAFGTKIDLLNKEIQINEDIKNKGTQQLFLYIDEDQTYWLLELNNFVKETGSDLDDNVIDTNTRIEMRFNSIDHLTNSLDIIVEPPEKKELSGIYSFILKTDETYDLDKRKKYSHQDNSSLFYHIKLNKLYQLETYGGIRLKYLEYDEIREEYISLPSVVGGLKICH